MRNAQTNIFTGFMLIYYITSMIFPHELYQQSSVRLIPQTIMASIGIYCLYIITMNIKAISYSRLLRPYLYMALLLFLYIPFIADNMTLFENIIYFFKMSMALLIMMALYILLRKSPIRTHRSIYFLFFMQLIYVTYMLFLHRHLQIDIYHNAHFNSNAGFTMICCVPMAIMIPQRRLRVYVYLAIVMGCLFGGQRSAALAALATLPLCWSYLNKYMKRFDYIILAILAVVAIYPILEMAISNFEIRNQMDREGGTIGSGRSEFWKVAWDCFWKGNAFNILFGNGLNSVAIVIEKYCNMPIGAHNGWLDNLYTFGVIGLSIYGNTIVSFFKMNKRINRTLPKYHNIFLIMGLLFLVKCTTSHGFWNIDVIPLSMAVAIIASNYRHTKNQYNEQKNVSYYK